MTVKEFKDRLATFDENLTLVFISNHCCSVENTNFNFFTVQDGNLYVNEYSD